MNLFVLIKQVPDTETKIKLKGDGSGIEKGDIKWIVSPYDEFAIEYALRTKETLKAGSVTAVTVGPDRCVEALRTALAMGCDEAMHIHSDHNDLDSALVGKALSELLKKQNCDAVFAGKQAIDEDQAAVFGYVAEWLGMPSASVVSHCEPSADGKSLKAHCESEGGTKLIVELPTPCLIAMTKAEHTPRYASLPGIMKAKKKEIKKFPLSEYAAGFEATTKDSKFELPPERKPGKMLSGEPKEQVAELVRLLREEAKVLSF